MAYKQTPGRGNMPKTGRGIPFTLMGKSPMRQEIDPRTGLKAKAEAEARKKQEQAGPNTGGSSDTRTFSGSASTTIPGDKVEKKATTPEEIKKWTEAKKRAEKAGLPFGERYKPQTITETATVSDTGKDKPVVETKKSNLSGKIYYSEDTNVKSGFGSHGRYGLTDDQSVLSAGRSKNAADTDMSNASLGSAFTTGQLNKWREVPQTETEARLHSKNILTKNNYNPARTSNPEKSANFLNKALEREKIYDDKVAKKKSAQDAAKAKVEAARKALEEKKAAKAKAEAAKKNNVPTKQLKKKKK